MKKLSLASPQGPVSKLLLQSGYSLQFTLSPLSGGSNNKVFRLKTDGCSLLLKEYFHSRLDQRNRLEAEYSFCRFAWERGIQTVPQPIACDRKNYIGLYEFIEGVPIRSEKINQGDILQVLKFFHELNRHKKEKQAKNLPESSEACYSLSDNVRCVDIRLERLKKIKPSTPINQKAITFVSQKLFPLWQKVRREIVQKASSIHLSLDQPICAQDRSLSHSDIGFHNAIRTTGGKIRFIDFEYSGWDDPAKMVCVFFSCPKVPIPKIYLKQFANSVASILKEPEAFLSRVQLLLPLHHIRWYGILLSSFLAVGSNRRKFSSEKMDLEKQKAIQLNKISDWMDHFIQFYPSFPSLGM